MTHSTLPEMLFAHFMRLEQACSKLQSAKDCWADFHSLTAT